MYAYTGISDPPYSLCEQQARGKKLTHAYQAAPRAWRTRGPKRDVRARANGKRTRPALTGSLITRGHQASATARPGPEWPGPRRLRQGQKHRPEPEQGNAKTQKWPPNAPIWVPWPPDKCTGGETRPRNRFPLVPGPADAKKDPTLPKFRHLPPIGPRTRVRLRSF